jgi:acyl carrier protein
MATLEEVRTIICEVLQLGEAGSRMDENSGLLGEVPEFDSMAVVYVITAIEDNFDVAIDDDEVDAEVFETLGSLHAFVNQKVSA